MTKVVKCSGVKSIKWQKMEILKWSKSTSNWYWSANSSLDDQSASTHVIPEYIRICKHSNIICKVSLSEGTNKTLDSRSLLLVTTAAKQWPAHYTYYGELVTKATHARLRTEHLYWEPWLRTRRVTPWRSDARRALFFHNETLYNSTSALASI